MAGYWREPVSDPLAEIDSLDFIECGRDAATHFAFGTGYTNLNHGFYRTYPVEVRNVFRHYQERTEARPDAFVRYEYRTHLLDKSRQALAEYLKVPMENLVFVLNATTAFDTILRNIVFKPLDVVIGFASIYGSFENTLIYLTETTPVEFEKIEYTLPVSDDFICSAFESAVDHLRAKGKNPRIAIFDTISSLPAARMPFEKITELCKKQKVLSCIDGAHAVGHFPLDLTRLDPDFFTSNCHKWLHVPRPCGMLYVPPRNQHLLRTTLPTGFNFIPLSKRSSAVGDPSAFVSNFASVGTLDDNAYLCIKAALEFRKKLHWSGFEGETAVMNYTWSLAQKGGQAVASILGTGLLDNESSTLVDCSMVNIRLPLNLRQIVDCTAQQGERIAQRIMKFMIVEYQTAVNVYYYDGNWWVRLSAQVYNTLSDFELAGKQLLEICGRVKKNS